MDGPTIINGDFYEIPVNEFVYRAGADIIKAPVSTTKLDLMRNDLIDLSNKIFTIIGHNTIDDND